MSAPGKNELPTIADIYQESDFIDAKDNQSDWRVGYIVGKYDHIKTFKVRFDGWQSKYDEVHATKHRTTSSPATNYAPSAVWSWDTPDRSTTLASGKGGNFPQKSMKR